ADWSPYRREAGPTAARPSAPDDPRELLRRGETRKRAVPDPGCAAPSSSAPVVNRLGTQNHGSTADFNRLLQHNPPERKHPLARRQGLIRAILRHLAKTDDGRVYL